jgi:hypothetical protein
MTRLASIRSPLFALHCASQKDPVISHPVSDLIT